MCHADHAGFMLSSEQSLLEGYRHRMSLAPTRSDDAVVRAGSSLLALSESLESEILRGPSCREWFQLGRQMEDPYVVEGSCLPTFGEVETSITVAAQGEREKTPGTLTQLLFGTDLSGIDHLTAVLLQDCSSHILRSVKRSSVWQIQSRVAPQ